MTEGRHEFVKRITWYVIPGIVSGLITGGIAYGTITTHIDYIQRDIDRVEEKTNMNARNINVHRIEAH